MKMDTTRAKFSNRQFVAAKHPVPSRHHIADEDALFARLVDLETYHRAQRILYPTLRELLPFVLVIASIFALNPSVVLGMTIDDFLPRKLFGKPRLRIFPMKHRSDRRQRIEIAVTADPENPGHLLPWLEKRGDTLRRLLPLPRRRDLFAWRSVRTNIALPALGAEAAWNDAMVDFEVKHGLRKTPPAGRRPVPETKLSQIRVTALDRVHELTGGDMVVVQAVAHHVLMSTTDEFYKTGGMTLRNQEALGDAMQKRHRDIRTGGTVSNLDRPDEIDDAAATPGFKCGDPYYQGIDRQKDNEMCGAYGHCPSCDLAFVNYGSLQSCALLHQLRERIDEAQRDDALVWLEKWAPVKRGLLLHLNRFPEKYHDECSNAIVPKLPPLE